MLKVKRALISVSDKEGVVELAKELKNLGAEIISTGGTAKALKEAGVACMDISEVTGFPEMLDGRVKTLHPKVHGGLLALRDKKEHMDTLEKHGIKPIDMVVVNLYPFKQVIKKEDIPLTEVIENIDIGGPSMIRSAAKNAQSVAVLTDKKDYVKILEELKNGGIKDETLNYLRVKAYKTTADYDTYISNYLEKKLINSEDLPDKILISVNKKQNMRYGENPHQKASFYVFEGCKETNIGDAEQLHGKELSFNNIYDMDAALNIVKDFDEPAAVVIKHANPCGVASDSDITKAYIKALNVDTVSAYGGIAAVNRKLTKGIAEEINKMFMEVVIAPEYETEAVDILKQKKNLRVIKTGPFKKYNDNTIQYMDIRKVVGGLLIQQADTRQTTINDLKVVTKKQPTQREIEDLLFAWKVVKFVKSNAIVIVKDKVSIGIGPGQTNRVGSAHIAASNAKEAAKGASLASDAFFPFRDSIDLVAQFGVTSVIQPGGSIRDDEVIKAADEHGIAMVFTGIRHFRH